MGYFSIILFVFFAKLFLSIKNSNKSLPLNVFDIIKHKSRVFNSFSSFRGSINYACDGFENKSNESSAKTLDSSKSPFFFSSLDRLVPNSPDSFFKAIAKRTKALSQPIPQMFYSFISYFFSLLLKSIILKNKNKFYHCYFGNALCNWVSNTVNWLKCSFYSVSDQWSQSHSYSYTSFLRSLQKSFFRQLVKITQPFRNVLQKEAGFPRIFIDPKRDSTFLLLLTKNIPNKLLFVVLPKFGNDISLRILKRNTFELYGSILSIRNKEIWE